MTQNEKQEYPENENGAVREGLDAEYTRHIPLEALAAAAASFIHGAEKYSDRNWEKGLPWQQMIDSLKRHIEDFERRKDFDDGPKGSGLPQVSMIMASAMMLTASVIRGVGEDDRLPAPDETAFTGKECTYWIEDALNVSRNFVGGNIPTDTHDRNQLVGNLRIGTTKLGYADFLKQIEDDVDSDTSTTASSGLGSVQCIGVHNGN